MSEVVREPEASGRAIREETSPPSARNRADADTGPAAERKASTPQGERIGKYEIRGLLGRGAMGAVYRAFDPVLEREVALKVMLPHIAGDPERKRQFEREARAVARLTHTNVVTVFDLGYHTDSSPYIVMELLRGQDLLHLARQEPAMSLSRKVSIVVQVLEGLGHAHKVGIVHRDIKPANIAITEEGTAKIMDFGIARLGCASATGEGPVMGSVAYMSPEHARGQAVDGRSDLFSVGSMLCELVTGRRPFEADSTVGSLYALAHSEPCLQLPPGPEYEGLLPILRKALAKDREARYATSVEFAEALATCLESSLPSPTVGPRPAAPERVGGDVGHRRAPLPRHAPLQPAPQPSSRPTDPSRLFRLLREVYVGQKSGHLHFAAARGCRSLRILKGQMVDGTSDVEGEHLGDVLVRYGVIAEAVRSTAVETVLGERRRLGEVLVSRGFLDEERLKEAVGLHVREILFAMLDGPEGSHSFEELSESAIDADVACPLSTGEVILEATRRVQNPALVQRLLGDTGRVLVPSSDPLLRSQTVALTPTDGFILSRIDGAMSAREVLSLSPVSTEDAERSLFSLLCTGIIDYTEKDATIRTPPSHGRPDRQHGVTTARRQAATPASTAPPPASKAPLTATSTPLRTSKPTSGHTSSDSEHSGAQVQSTPDLRQLILEAHGRLRGDHFEVLGLSRSATEKDVKRAYAQFVRLLHPDVHVEPSLADVEDQRKEVFIRLTQAYETLRDLDLRREYEIAFEPSKLDGPATPAPAPVSASKADVAVDPVPPAPPQDPARPDPEVVVREAEVLLANQAYWDVIQRVEPFIAGLDGPVRTRAVLVLARAYMKNPRWQKQAEGLLLDLLRQNPDCSPACCFLGHLYASHGLVSRARSMFRRVLEIEPDHRAAAAALEDLDEKGEMDERPGDAQARTGRLQSWFKSFGRSSHAVSHTEPAEES